MELDFDFDFLEVDTHLLSQTTFNKIAVEEVHNTLARNGKEWDKGKDPDGNPIKNGGYANKKKPGPVDLIDTGKLKASRQIKKESDGATGYFSADQHPQKRRKDGSLPEEGITNAALAAILAKKFSFPFGFGKKDQDRITKRFSDEVNKLLDKAINVKRID